MNDHPNIGEEEENKEAYVSRLLSGIEGIDDSEMQKIKEEQDKHGKALKAKSFSEQIPKRYRNAHFEGDPKLLEAQRSVIYGPYGTGKTHMGYSIARELFVEGRVHDFKIARERDIYNDILANQKTPGEIKRKYCEVDLLVIDEFGKSSGTDSSASQIFNIIDYRYDWELRTILICNAADGKALKDIVPEAVRDRFVGSTHLLGGLSRRKPE